LFGNIYLDALDRAMEALPEVIYLRYADDWCALARTQEAAEQALQVARGVVEDHLHLRLHPEKTRILDAQDTPFDFLGFTFFWTDSGNTGRPLFGPKSAATERLKERVRALTRRKRPVSLEMVIQDLAPVIRGWGQYFTISHHGEYYRLDAWIRERCRAFVAKRWNRSRALDRVWTNQRLADLDLPSLAAMRRHVLAHHPRP
jgi:RNA-directed DNA polymerase